MDELYIFSPESCERFIPSHTGEQSLSGHAVRPTYNQTVAQDTSLTEVPSQDITFVGRGCLTPQRQLMKKLPGRIPFRVTRTYTAKRRNGHYLTPILGGTPVKNPGVTAIYSRNEGIIYRKFHCLTSNSAIRNYYMQLLKKKITQYAGVVPHVKICTYRYVFFS